MKTDERFARAYSAWRVGDHASAETYITECIEENPDSDDAFLLLGNILVRTGRAGDAIAAFRTAIEKNPENLEALNGLGVVCRQLGRTTEALSAFRAALKVDPNDAAIHYNLGNVYKQSGDAAAAEQAYRAAAQHDPELSVAWNNLGTMLQSQGRLHEAISVFRQGLVHDPNHPGLHYNLGVAYEQDSQQDAAIDEYRKALNSRPGWVDALNNLGVILQRRGELDEAARVFRELLKITDQSALAHNNLATIEAQLGRLEAARAHYQSALKIDPSYHRAVKNLAHLLRAHSSLPDSVDELGELVQRNSDDANLRLLFAGACMEVDRLTDAETQLEEVLGMTPGNVEALRLLGTVYFRLGRRDAADECFARIPDIDPENDDFRVDEACLYAEAGEPEAALSRIDAYLATHPEDRAGLLLRAESLLAMERAEEALELLRELRERLPDDSRVISLMARAQQELGSVEAALETTDRLISLQGNRASVEDLEAISRSLELYESTVDDLRNDTWEENLQRLAVLMDEASRDISAVEAESLEVEEVGEIDAESIPILGSWGQEFFADEDEKPLRLSDLQEEVEEPQRPERPEGPGRSLLDLSEVEAQGFRRLAEQEDEEIHHRIIRKTTEEIHEPPPRPEPEPQQPSPGGGFPPGGGAPGGWPPAPSGGPGSGPERGGAGGDAVAGSESTSGVPEHDDRDDLSSGGFYPHYATPYSGITDEDTAGGLEHELEEELGEEIDELEDLDDTPATPTVAADGSFAARGDQTIETPIGPSREPSPADPVPGPPAGVPDEHTTWAAPPWVDADTESDPEPDIDTVDAMKGDDLGDEHPGLSRLMRAAEALRAIAGDEQEEYGLEETADEPVPKPSLDAEAGDDAAPTPAGPEEESETPRDAGAVPAGAMFPGGVPQRRATDRVPQPRPRPENIDPRVRLLDYLVGMAKALPEEKRGEFLHSEMRLKIESLRNRLLGRRGLKRDLERYAPIRDREQEAHITAKRVADAMRFVQSMSGFLPDPSISSVLNSRLDGIVQKLQDFKTAKKESQ
ncbi:MAG: tetratricopeptide repeat protein [Spirochaetaceae bacterium]|nr:MAG: tetratricopeptide repeat protein [Spirochaetaceae bacterium]